MRWMIWLVVTVSMLLTGCASPTEPPNRYMLPDSGAALPSAASDPSRLLIVQPPRLAHYLDTDGIVLQLDDITLNAARQHLWVEPLGRQLERGLRDRLATHLPDTRIMHDEARLGRSEALRLRLEVDRFQGHHDGFAIVSGEWQLLAPDGRLLAMERFLEQTALDDDGYPALVRALGSGWDQVAAEIASGIRQAR
ncbi:MAG: ABC-type transport auxiliary lipoprotein family protein [Halomonas sp.]|nr:ABC-type transport auxiliary lipoprotein family protein [Halomonas sp.]MDX5503277.1 ABC-type transport auxiliary lipoprotein family protein [Halomonas sp.]